MKVTEKKKEEALLFLCNKSTRIDKLLFFLFSLSSLFSLFVPYVSASLDFVSLQEKLRPQKRPKTKASRARFLSKKLIDLRTNSFSFLSLFLLCLSLSYSLISFLGSLTFFSLGVTLIFTLFCTQVTKFFIYILIPVALCLPTPSSLLLIISCRYMVGVVFSHTQFSTLCVCIKSELQRKIPFDAVLLSCLFVCLSSLSHSLCFSFRALRCYPVFIYASQLDFKFC